MPNTHRYVPMYGYGAMQKAGGGGGAGRLDFETEWDTTGTNETITLPALSSANDFWVTWETGGIPEHVTTASPSHVYAAAGTYNISITGTCPTWSFNNSGDKLKIKDVKNNGRIGLTELGGGYHGCSNMLYTATDAGDFSAVTNMGSMFNAASLANPNTLNWNVSSVTNMANMFNGAAAANPDVSLWVVGSVTNMGSMFRDAIIANPDVSNWDVSSVTAMANMFRSTSANPDVSGWDVSSVTNMTNMFLSALLSDANYDLLLAAWSLLSLQSSVVFNAGAAKYTEAAARLIMTDPPNSWTITDGGPA